MLWIGSRRIVDEHTEFAPDVDMALREYRGRGIYKHTGERIAPHIFYGASGIPIESEQDFDNIFK